MAHGRARRLGEQLRREIATMLRYEVRDPRVGFATPTEVKVTSDLSYARVFVQLAGTGEERAEQIAGLEAAAPFLRRRLGQELHIRRVPELRFVEDRTLDAARRIETLLEEQADDASPDDPEGTSSSEADATPA